jgi:Restriction endonuclease
VAAKRLPSFNDFSPVILKNDLRACLRVIADGEGKDNAIIGKWADLFFKSKKNKRSSTNIPATLSSTGLAQSQVRPFALTEFGRQVLKCKTPQEAAQTFCREMIEAKNGDLLLRAVRELTDRGDAVTKASLKAELRRLGIVGLSTNTTDHTTLLNWMRVASIVTGPPNGPQINDVVLKQLTGVSSAEQDAFEGLTLPQQLFLQVLRKRHETESGPFLVEGLLQELIEAYPHLFDEGQFAKQVRIPLVAEKWIQVTGLPTGGQGGKSGWVGGAELLLGIPIAKLIPDFDQVIPAHVRKRIRTPLKQILEWLEDTSDKNKRGLGLELLAVRMVLDLQLEPRDFRQESKDTAFAEVDVTAEGSHLLFSRWTFQCKNRPTANVGVSDVAKEVGVAIYMRAHVIVMVSMSGFTGVAHSYARQVTRATHLQFVFVPGSIVRGYLRGGAAVLWRHVLNSARAVMAEKRSQPVQLSEHKE